jgi:hypothetical protein
MTLVVKGGAAGGRAAEVKAAVVQAEMARAGVAEEATAEATAEVAAEEVAEMEEVPVAEGREADRGVPEEVATVETVAAGTARAATVETVAAGTARAETAGEATVRAVTEAVAMVAGRRAARGKALAVKASVARAVAGAVAAKGVVRVLAFTGLRQGWADHEENNGLYHVRRESPQGTNKSSKKVKELRTKKRAPDPPLVHAEKRA